MDNKMKKTLFVILFSFYIFVADGHVEKQGWFLCNDFESTITFVPVGEGVEDKSVNIGKRLDDLHTNLSEREKILTDLLKEEDPSRNIALAALSFVTDQGEFISIPIGNDRPVVFESNNDGTKFTEDIIGRKSLNLFQRDTPFLRENKKVLLSDIRTFMAHTKQHRQTHETLETILKEYEFLTEHFPMIQHINSLKTRAECCSNLKKRSESFSNLNTALTEALEEGEAEVQDAISKLDDLQEIIEHYKEELKKQSDLLKTYKSHLDSHSHEEHPSPQDIQDIEEKINTTLDKIPKHSKVSSKFFTSNHKGKLNKIFCHSEQKLSHFLSPVFLAKKIEELKDGILKDKTVVSTFLSVHSRNDICENCGTGLLISAYGENGLDTLIAQMLSISAGNFHIIGSFREWRPETQKEDASPIEGAPIALPQLRQVLERSYQRGFLVKYTGINEETEDKEDDDDYLDFLE